MATEFTGKKVENLSVGGGGDLQERLREHNAYIDMVLAMIPPRHFLSDEMKAALRRQHYAQTSDAAAAAADDGEEEGKRMGQGKQEGELSGDEGEEAGARAKWELHANAKTANRRAHGKFALKLRKSIDKERILAVPAIQDVNSVPLLIRARAEADRLAAQHERDQKKNGKPSSSLSYAHVNPVSVSKEALRERLKTQIEEFRRARNAPEEEEVSRKRKEREEVEKSKLRVRRKEQKRAKKQRGKDDVDVSIQKAKLQDDATTASSAKLASEIKALKGSNGPSVGSSSGSSSKPSIQFGAIDFSTGTPVPTYLSQRKKPTNQYLLKKAEAKQALLKEANLSGEKQTAVSKELWSKALAKAQGQKIKDDPAMLRKAIRKEKSMKVRSAKKWAERTDSQQQEREKRLARRDNNVQKRLQYKKERRESQRKGISKKQFDKVRMEEKKKKWAEATKTKTHRAGFEGKKIQKSPAK